MGPRYSPPYLFVTCHPSVLALPSRRQLVAARLIDVACPCCLPAVCGCAHSDLNERHRRLAEITEMIHTASLVHDDVLDDCSIRRGERGARAGQSGSLLARQ